MPLMEWKSLLDHRRIRDLFDGGPTQRVQSELRGEIERDYGRCLFSTPVRRLIHKTQFFPLERNDSVRTRLAHSLEVSSVARSLGMYAARFIKTRDMTLEFRHLQDIEWIAATCGLIHDLGNPPFGHAGELAIGTWFQDQLHADGTFFDTMDGKDSQYAKDFLKFEGNAQTLRLVSHLQLLSDPYGLNLTTATFSAACKYLASSAEADRENPNHAFAKPGYFSSERSVVDKVRMATGTHNRRNPITYLVEAADDIVYTTVDLEDAVKKKLLQWNQVEPLLKKSTFGESIIEKVRRRVSGDDGETLAQLFRVIAITEMVSSALEVFKSRYTLIMNGEYGGELIGDPDSPTQRLCEIIRKEVLKPHLYTSPEILRLEVRGRKVIHDLMTMFWEATKETTGTTETQTYPGKLYLLTSDNYRRVFTERLNKAEEPDKYIRLQLVTDTVSGMTDSFACQLHKELTNGV